MKWNNLLAPVAGVSWFEAEAYCNWLSRELGKPICLPTEEEWERAARYTDGREYPWGDEFDRNRLNSAEFWGYKNDLDWDQLLDSKGFEVVSTTAVGQFETGSSVAGASDMSGNVWEWTNSWYDKGHTMRSVRGGSWIYGQDDVRCASRHRYIPGYFDSIGGFRIVSPGS